MAIISLLLTEYNSACMPPAGAATSYKEASVPARYRKGRGAVAEDTSDDSDFNPYEDEPNIG